MRTLTILTLLVLLLAAPAAADDATAVHTEAARFTFAVLKNGAWDAEDWAYEKDGMGGGIGFRKDGWILTTAHQIRGAKEVMLICPDGVGRKADRWIWSSKMDLGVVHVPDYVVPVARFATTDAPRIGATAYTVGWPHEWRLAMTRGIVSGVHRELFVDGKVTKAIQDYIQTDAQANAGNSGGPLLGEDGTVLGMICESLSVLKKATPGISFAIPAPHLRALGNRLIEEEKAARHGCLRADQTSCWHLHESFRKEHDFWGTEGALLGEPTGTAKEAGLRHADIVLAVDGHGIVNWTHLRALIGVRKPGETVVLSIHRKGERLEIPFAVDTWPD